MMNAVRRTAGLFVVMAALFAPAAIAQSLTAEETAAMEARLQLTPEQKAAVEPILRNSMVARQSTFQKYGVDFQSCKRPGAIGLIRLNKDMNRINADTRTRLSKILSPVQMKEYDKIVAEQTVIVKKQIMC